MKEKLELYFRILIACICFSITISLSCMAENSLGTEKHISPDSATLDTGDAYSVRQMIDELEDMREECLAAIYTEENRPGEESLNVSDELKEGEWITLDRAVCVRIPADTRNKSYLYVMLCTETDASVIWKTTVLRKADTTEIYEGCWYLSEGQLIGYQTGLKDDRINFAGILPQWKEEHRGETKPLFGDGYISEWGEVLSYADASDLAGYYQERAVSILNPEVPGPLESVDIRLEEMADQTDPEDASSVASYIRDLYRMQEILSRESMESVAEKELKERIVDLPINTEGSALAWKTEDGRGGVIRISGGDSYSMYFIFDRELIGVQKGNSAGTITFASQIPKWKDDDTSMDVPLVGNEPMGESPEMTISRESVSQIYDDIIEEIWQ